MRRRLFRSVHIGLFLSSIAALGAHCQHGILAAPASASPAAISHDCLTYAYASPFGAALDAAPVHAPVAGALDTSLSQPPAPYAAWRRMAGLIHQEMETRRQAIPFRKVFQLSQGEPAGSTRVGAHGQNGLLEKLYQVTYRGAKPVKYVLEAKRIVRPAVDMQVLAGYTDRAARAMPSRGGIYSRTREIDMVATGYSPMEGSGTGRCANGMRAGYGVVAVDPRLIPLGSKLFIQGYGYALAGDTGGAIRGHRIDLGQNTYRAAAAVGRRHVHVFVLSEGR